MQQADSLTGVKISISGNPAICLLSARLLDGPDGLPAACCDSSGIYPPSCSVPCHSPHMSSYLIASPVVEMPVFSNRGGDLDALLHRRRPGFWDRFIPQPCVDLARKLYSWQPRSPTPPESLPVSVVCLSDTHNGQPTLPDGDVLVHAGDLTQSGTFEELHASLSWLSSHPHPIKVVIAGNHDLLLDAKQDATGNRTKSTTDPTKSPETLRASLPWDGIIYLHNQDTTVTCRNGRRLRIYGSPYSPRYGNWAFQYPRDEDAWHGTIPEDTDILITHAPPRGHRDLNFGCVHLLRELWRVRPRLHVFGHVHEGVGTEVVQFDALQSAYERTAIAGGGVWNLIRTAYRFFGSLFRRGFGAQEMTGARSTLVNPAIAGGLRDVQARQPVKVVI